MAMGWSKLPISVSFTATLPRSGDGAAAVAEVGAPLAGAVVAASEPGAGAAGAAVVLAAVGGGRVRSRGALEVSELEHAASRRSAATVAGRARAMSQPAPRGATSGIAQGTTRMRPSCTTVTTRWPSCV